MLIWATENEEEIALLKVEGGPSRWFSGGGRGQLIQDAFEGLKGRSELERSVISEDPSRADHSLPSCMPRSTPHSCKALGRSFVPSFCCL